MTSQIEKGFSKVLPTKISVGLLQKFYQRSKLSDINLGRDGKNSAGAEMGFLLDSIWELSEKLSGRSCPMTLEFVIC